MNVEEFPQFERGPCLEGTTIEIRNPRPPGPAPRFVLFDFDGTISLIRTGWQEVMIGMMMDVLRPLSPAEEEEPRQQHITDYVDRLTGKQTIYQMRRLAQEVERRGGRASHPREYKSLYHQRLMARIAGLREELRRGAIDPDECMLPRTRDLLEALQERNCRLYLASGTDLSYVEEEAALLRVDHYFDGGIHGALDRVEDFSKAQVIHQIFKEHGLEGPELLSFGDGYVEILNTKEVQGIAVGVASDEIGRQEVNEWKRNRLIQAGADLIIPGYTCQERLLEYLFRQ